MDPLGWGKSSAETCGNPPHRKGTETSSRSGTPNVDVSAFFYKKDAKVSLVL